MGTTWVLSAPDGPHVGRMNVATGEANIQLYLLLLITICKKFSETTAEVMVWVNNYNPLTQ